MNSIFSFFILFGDTALMLLLYSKISGYVFSGRAQILLILLHSFLLFPAYFLLGTVFFEPIFFLLISLLLGRFSWSVSIFYALFPIVLSNLFGRILSFFIMPFFSITLSEINHDIISIKILSLLGIGFSFIFLTLLDYDFSQLKERYLHKPVKTTILYCNIVMIVYYFLIQSLILLENHFLLFSTDFYRQLLVMICLLFLPIFLTMLDRNIRKDLQEEIDFQKNQQFKNILAYSHHVEDLYRDIRSFRHDYINILTSIRLGLEQKDLKMVQKVYDDVLKDSNHILENKQYDIGRLVNIQDDAIKSVLSAKLAEAQQKQITVALEVPAEFKDVKIEKLDFIRILSILCDNAIEAAIEAEHPEFFLSLIAQERKQILIVQNTTKEKQINTAFLYGTPQSSKGENRGVGLVNINKIIGKYPTVSIKTSSENYIFRQVIEIN